MGKSVINLAGTTDEKYVEHYGDEITSVRIYRLEDAPFGVASQVWNDDQYDTPWQMDGIDVRVDPPRVTEEVWNFTTFEQAIASVADFLTNYTLVSRLSEPCSHEILGSSGDCAGCGHMVID